MSSGANYIAAVSMQTFEKQIAINTNNIGNAQTRGYKDYQALIKDIGYQYEKGANNFADNMAEQGIQYGMGSSIASTVRLLTQGQLEGSSSQYDIAINGNGYFQILLSDGTIAYTKDGTFTLDKDRRVVTTEGNPLVPEIIVPQETKSIIIKDNGEVYADVDGQLEPQNITQIQLAVFTNENGLRSVGNNLQVVTDASGEPILGYPGDDGFGRVKQSFYEGSNTNVLKNIMEINTASKIYAFLSKVIQQYGQMQDALNNRI